MVFSTRYDLGNVYASNLGGPGAKRQAVVATAPRGTNPSRAPRTTTGDVLNQANWYEVPHKEKLQILQQISDVQWNDQIIGKMSNEDATDAWYVF